MTPLFLKIYVFCFGLCIGSFLNVCIFRLPSGKSIVKPPSSCVGCGAPIRWRDNIPVLSYVLLAGRCRTCKTRISIRYPIVELLTGAFALLVWMRFGFTVAALAYFIFIAALLVITFIDLDHWIIPDVISLPGIPVGFALSFVIPALDWTESALGIIAGGGSLWLVASVYQLISKKEGMGFGDVKLLAMIGAFLGWKGVLFTIMASSLTGTVVGLTMMLRRGESVKMPIPFGPFLAFGAILYLFFGPQIIDWYFYELI